MVVLLDREELPQSVLCVPLHRLEASAVSWRIHVHKPSTHVLTPLKLGALREMACDNIFLISEKSVETPVGIRQQ